ncbi:iron-siderophore ABC transporter substrate-binding protein [Corynebacterium bovis]|uniref:iron-siderophore ABC transporter substrate-binding protein n=1 Tax=Corynebacterium bovis TaxID=36808 RepID=UPI00244C54DF|nr:iron-siderophore ABC transporter substrate-binding protein [Corynebacterium bovis]MDH2456848.1 iron-siderophore ABC transporter substrate-binding protein [Corynebacterium bovis]
MTITRTIIATGAAVLLVGGLAACSDGNGNDNDTSTTSSAASGASSGASSDAPAAEAEAGAFPTTITHKFGTTEVKEAPKRVVSLGYTDQDALLALGVTPVAVTEWSGMAPEGQAAGNWANDRVQGDKPEILSGDSIDVEKVAALKPDLIIATYSDVAGDEGLYKRLSDIAPVVVQKGDYKDFQQPWDVTTEEIGQAVGKPKEAKKLVDDVKAKMTALKDKHPEWAGKTVAVATVEDDNLSAFASKDPRSQFFEALGFTPKPEIDKDAGDAFYAKLSKEKADVLDADVLVWDQLSYSPKKDKTSITDDPILGQLPPVKDGHAVYLEGELEKAFGWQTVLSLDYVLDNIEKPLVDATA